jgi:Zinc carboxypeptidase/FlgD Ig-like domain
MLRISRAILSIGVLLAGAAAGTPLAFATDPTPATPVYEEVHVTLPTREDAIRVLRAIPEIEVMKPVGDGDDVYRILSTPEIDRKLAAMGYAVEVIVPDLEAAYDERSLGPGFGMFHTYSETVEALDSLATLYPSIMSAKFSIGTTGELRNIWAVKISDNHEVDEDEAEVLFDGVTHAREIMTVEVVLAYIKYLLDGYGVDPIATFLVDNREFWFVPILNPDGFVYNETTNPNGGGFWRKNRRPNAGGCFGVDNNRNYPYAWGGQGADTDPCSDVYRGPAPGSEPENQAIMNLINGRDFAVHQSYHSAAALILHSWGYDDQVQAPDDSLLTAHGLVMARDSGYLVGQPGPLLYNASGVAFDWSYGDTTEHSKIIAYTSEIGGSGFWPAPSEVPGLQAENVWSNIYLSLIAGVYLQTSEVAVSGENGNGRLDAGETANLTLSIENSGVRDAATGVTATIASDDPYLTLVTVQSSFGTIAAGTSEDNGAAPFVVAVDPSCPEGHEAALTLTISADDGYAAEDAITLTIGVPQLTPVYTQTFETTNDWAQDPTHNATAGAWVAVDPNPTGFQTGDDATPDPGVIALITGQNAAGNDGGGDVDGGISATRSPVIDLSTVTKARLDLAWTHGQRDAGGDPIGDFFRIAVSNDGGGTYPVNLIAFGDGSHSQGWNFLSVRLDTVLALSSQMRLRVQAADGTVVGDVIEGGVDEVHIYDVSSENLAPSVPVAVSPVDGASTGMTPRLRVANATDPEGDPLTYGFRVYSDALLTTLVASADDVPEDDGITQWQVSPPLTPGGYFWRAFAKDAGQRGLFCAAEAFTVTAPTGVGDGAAAAGVALASPGPNPTPGAARVAYSLPSGGRVFVAVLNAEGRVVRIIENGWRAAGRHEALWDGNDSGGRAVASGQYFLRLEAGTERRTRTITVVR